MNAGRIFKAILDINQGPSFVLLLGFDAGQLDGQVLDVGPEMLDGPQSVGEITEIKTIYEWVNLSFYSKLASARLLKTFKGSFVNVVG